jgi:hypothetical protein
MKKKARVLEIPTGPIATATRAVVISVYGFIARTTDQFSDSSSATYVMPASAEVSHRPTVITSEYALVWLLGMNALDKQLTNDLGHSNFPCVTVFGLPRI